MDNALVARYMRLLEPLAVDIKLELLSSLSASVKKELGKKSSHSKDALLDEISGAWKNMDDKLVSEILNERTSSDRNINLDT